MHIDYTLAAAPGGLPLIGHTLQMLTRPLQLLQSLRKHGDVAVIRLASTPIYVVNHPDLIRQILTADARKFDKGLQFEKARPYVGNGIASSSEPLHRRQRRLMQPAFHQLQVGQYMHSMQRCARSTIDAWPQGRPLALEGPLFEFTIRVLTDTLFSTEADDRVITEITESLPVLLNGIAWRIAVPTQLLERLPTRSNRRFQANRERLRATIDRLVARHREAPPGRIDLLAMLLGAREEETGAPMSDEQIRDEVMTMMFAGTETTASTLGWVCNLLAEHPAVQERLQAEVDSVLGGRPVGVDDLPRLKYARQVINEALRLYPPVWLMSRRPLEDVEIGGHRIAAGSHVFFSTYAVHRDPELHRDPERFDPERWAGEKSRGTPRSSFMPFGAGSRGCIGEPFAWAEMLVFLGALLGSRSLHPAPNRRAQLAARGSLRAQGLYVITRARG